MKLMLFSAFSALVSMDSFASELSEFMPKSPQYIVQMPQQETQCINQLVKQSLSKGFDLSVGTIQNHTGAVQNTAFDNALSSALWGLTRGSLVNIIDLTFFPKAKHKYLISSSLLNIENTGPANSGGITISSKYLTIGGGKLKRSDLISMNYRVHDTKTGYLKFDVNLNQVIESYEREYESEAGKHYTGLSISWGNDSGHSLDLVYKMLGHQAAKLLLSHMTGLDFSSCSSAVRSPLNIERLTVKSRDDVDYEALYRMKRRQFPRALKRHVKCNKFGCKIKFKDRATKHTLGFVEDAFYNAYSDLEDVNVDCSLAKKGREISCYAVGKIENFDPRRFKRALYDE